MLQAAEAVPGQSLCRCELSLSKLPAAVTAGDGDSTALLPPCHAPSSRQGGAGQGGQPGPAASEAQTLVSVKR